MANCILDDCCCCCCCAAPACVLTAAAAVHLAWRCGTLSWRMFACAGGAGLTHPAARWASLQSILRNSRFTKNCAASQSIVAVALAEVIPGPQMGARGIGGVASRLATERKFHGRFVSALRLLYDSALGSILVCCSLALRLGSNLDRSSFENGFGFASNFNLAVINFGLLSSDCLRWGNEPNGGRTEFCEGLNGDGRTNKSRGQLTARLSSVV